MTRTNSAPLAVDGEGKPIALPDGASHWNIRRHTGGRPRLMLDASKQPLRLGLEMTLADLEDILAPAKYWLDLIDQAGNSLGLAVRPVLIGGPANEERTPERDAVEDAPAAPLPLGSDVRLVLEANVRAMQASFQHNQRTLELGLRMAETLRDGVKVLADAQADWIKSLASAKGYLRNAATVPAALPPPPSRQEDEEEDEESVEDDYDEPAPPQHWTDKLGESLAPLAAPLATHLIQTAMAPKPDGGSASSGIMDKAREMLDWRRAAAAGAVKRAKDANPVPPSSAGGLMALAASAPPEVTSKVMSAMQQLTADERHAITQIVSCFQADDIPLLIAQVKELSVDELVAKLRSLLATPSA